MKHAGLVAIGNCFAREWLVLFLTPLNPAVNSLDVYIYLYMYTYIHTKTPYSLQI